MGNKENKMFCFQCQETAGCSGCTVSGVCGKKPDVAAMQDLLVYVTKGLSAVTTELRFDGKEIEAYVNEMIIVNLFTTITNANFDKDSIIERIKNTLATKEELIRKVENREVLPEAALWKGTEADFEAKASRVGVLSTENEDIRSLRELITYGLKGLAAYAKHAAALAHTDVEIDAFLQRALAATLDDSLSADQLTALTLETGSYGVKVMELLDKANTETYGNPEITKVNIGVGKNPGILVSGHDLRDLEMLLEQTQGTGVDVYTHSEMLPAHYYPAFKKYSNFIGNYGNAWWKQKEERTATRTVCTRQEQLPIRDAPIFQVLSEKKKIFLRLSNRQRNVRRRKKSSMVRLWEDLHMHRYLPLQIRLWKQSNPEQFVSLLLWQDVMDVQNPETITRILPKDCQKIP
mgnify:CR=1 FL=1